MRVLIVVPTYNERENIDAVVARTLAHPDIDLLVVDDGSPDGTGVRADQLAEHEPRLRVIHRASKNGLGPAYRQGLGLGMDEGYELLIEMDADLSHDPAVIPTLIDRAQHADLVIGSRYIPGGGVENWPWHRRVLSYGGNVYVRLLTGLPVRDATSGFRAFHREVLEEIGLRELRSDGYSFQLETALQTWLAGYHIDEAPIVFIERVAGQSKISRGIVFEAMARVLVWAVRCLPHRVRGIKRNPRSITAVSQS
ncbi:MAG: dolichol-phosphate mannosyltransferase [Myxococcota bacterium]